MAAFGSAPSLWVTTAFNPPHRTQNYDRPSLAGADRCLTMIHIPADVESGALVTSSRMWITIVDLDGIVARAMAEF